MEQLQSYNATAKILHWGIAGLVALQFITAWIAPEVESATSPSQQISIHLSFGVLVVMLMVVRVLWRFAMPAPELPASINMRDRLLTVAGHGLLYVSLIALPLSGWMLASAKGWQPTFFGWYTFAPLGLSASVAQLIGELHGALASLVLLLIIGHIGFALYHKYFLNDGVWERMLPAFLLRA